MKNKRLINYAFLTLLIFSPTVFAENKAGVDLPTVSNDVINDITAELSKELAKELSKEKVAEAIQDYQAGEIERAQPRRSALFKHILNAVVNGSTLASAADAKPAAYNRQLSGLFESDGTLL